MTLHSFLFLMMLWIASLSYPTPDVQITVSDSNSLKAALKVAAPGTCITMKPGYYIGPFEAHGKGTKLSFIRLEGEGYGENVILTAKEDKDNTAYWLVSRFVAEGGDVSIKLDGAKNMQFDSIIVHNSGSHGWWITHSSDNLFRRLQIYDTGRKYSHIGAGMRIGTPWRDGNDNCSNNKFIHLRIGPGIKAPGFEMLEGSKNSELMLSFFDQIPYFLLFKGNNWTVKDCKMRTLRSMDSADSVVYDSFEQYGKGNVLKTSVIDVAGSTATDYCAFFYDKAKKGNNKICSSNKFIGYRKQKANKNIDGC